MRIRRCEDLCSPDPDKLNLNLSAECLLEASGKGNTGYVRALVKLIRERYLLGVVPRQKAYLRDIGTHDTLLPVTNSLCVTYQQVLWQ